MAKRYSKRALKKRRTLRKSRSNKRHRKTQRGGIPGSLLGKMQSFADGAGGAGATMKLIISLKEMGKATTAFNIILNILKDFPRNPVQALKILNEKRADLESLLDQDQKVKDCLTTLQDRIQARINQGTSAVAASLVAEPQVDETSFIDEILVKGQVFAAADNKGDVVKKVILDKKENVKNAIDTYLKDTANKDIIECVTLLKERIIAKIESGVEELKSKFVELRVRYSSEETKVIDTIKTVKQFMDSMKQTATPAASAFSNGVSNISSRFRSLGSF